MKHKYIKFMKNIALMATVSTLLPNILVGAQENVANIETASSV